MVGVECEATATAESIRQGRAGHGPRAMETFWWTPLWLALMRTIERNEGPPPSHGGSRRRDLWILNEDRHIYHNVCLETREN